MKDRFDRTLDYLRISVTDQCNLRCTYCMPEKGIPLMDRNDIMTKEEILALVGAFISLGVTKVRITGGEPLLRPDLTKIIRGIRDLGAKEIVMTTNAITLVDKAQELKEAGLDRVNISLDTLDPDKFRQITRGGDLDDVIAGIRAAKEAGLTPVKLNVVLMKDFNDTEVAGLMELTREDSIHVRFIELMPLGQAEGRKSSFLPVSEVISQHPELRPLPADDHSVARIFQKAGYGGTIGFINPVSCNFCASCNRLRVSATGKLRLCLHGAESADLKQALSQGRDLQQVILSEIEGKPQSHHLEIRSEAGTNMNEIGG